jgi:hypothetical protein
MIIKGNVDRCNWLRTVPPSLSSVQSLILRTCGRLKFNKLNGCDCFAITTPASRRYSLRPLPRTDVLRDRTAIAQKLPAATVCSTWRCFARQSASVLAGTLHSEAAARDQFLRHNQVKRWTPRRTKWTGSGIYFTVNMTEKPPVRSDIWSCVSHERAMNARQLILSNVFTYRNKFKYVSCFLCKYLICGNNRSYSYRKTPSLVTVYAPGAMRSEGSSDLGYLTAHENFKTHNLLMV